MKMSKSTALTALGVALALVCALGSWGVVSAMLNRQDEQLAGPIGSLAVQPAAAEPGEARYTLTMEEIHEVLAALGSAPGERYHEPREGQISMQQAIDAATAGLGYFVEQGVLPKALSQEVFSEMGARLGTPVYEATASDDIDPLLSFWTIYLSSETLTVEMAIHAMTGSVWNMYIHTRSWSAEEVDTHAFLDAFALQMGLEGGGEYLDGGDLKQAKRASLTAADPAESELAYLTYEEYGILVAVEKGYTYSGAQEYYSWLFVTTSLY